MRWLQTGKTTMGPENYLQRDKGARYGHEIDTDQGKLCVSRMPEASGSDSM